jgi:hypothetical protein
MGDMGIKLKGTLATRLVLILLAFVAIPLLLHTFWLYDEEASQCHREVRGEVLLFVLLFVLLGGSFAYGISLLFMRPYQRLLQAMKNGEPYTPSLFGFEVNDLGQALNERITQKEDLLLARRLQEALLPKQWPRQGMKGAYLPYQEVGGDFYDAVQNKERTLFLIADVAGKGVPACLLAFSFRSVFRALSGEPLPSLVSHLQNALLSDVGPTGYFITAWIGELTDHTLSYASFGHPPALLKRSGAITPLATDSGAFGLESFSPQIRTEPLQNGDRLLLYTDGLLESSLPLAQTFLEQDDPATILKQAGPLHDDGALLIIKIDF